MNIIVTKNVQEVLKMTKTDWQIVKVFSTVILVGMLVILGVRLVDGPNHKLGTITFQVPQE